MINTSSTPSALLSNLAAVPAVPPTAAAQRAGSAREAPQQGDAERRATADNGFARAMKQAVAQRTGKPAAPPARAPATTPEPGASADAALARKAAGKGHGPHEEAASDHRTEVADTTRQASPEAAAGPLTAPVASPAAAAQAYGAAVAPEGAGELSADARGSGTARLQASISGARLAPAGPDGTIASGAAAVNRSLANAAQAVHQPAPAIAKPGDSDPGGTTPLPRPQPPSATDVAPELMHAALAHTRALPAVAADPPSATDAAPDLVHAGLAHTRALPAVAADTRAAAGAETADRHAAGAGSGQAAALAARSVADQGQTGSGAQHGHQQHGADVTPRAAVRAASTGSVHAAASVPAHEAADGDLRGAANTAPTPAAFTDSNGTFTAGAAPAAGVAGSSPPATAPAAATSGELPTGIDSPVNSPAFAAEAGYRIAVLVREGVESAQLQLNPAEMGPVTVQIVIDGQTAQVHLAAANAETRQALEASMPQLASNLRESGLTLTGGGVSEQAPRQQGNAQDGSGSGDRSSRNGNGTGNGNSSFDAQRPPPATRGGSNVQRRGVVDLVA